MAAAALAPSLLAAGGTAAAGTLGTVMTVAGIAGQAFSMFQGLQAGKAEASAQRAAAQAQLDATRTQVAQQGVEEQRAKTRMAQEQAERERRLRRVQAAQKAQFAGGGVDITTGTPAAIQDAAVSQINREARLSEDNLQDTLTTLSIQSKGIQAAGLGKAQSLINAADTGLMESRTRAFGQLRNIAGDIQDFRET